LNHSNEEFQVSSTLQTSYKGLEAKVALYLLFARSGFAKRRKKFLAASESDFWLYKIIEPERQTMETNTFAQKPLTYYSKPTCTLQSRIYVFRLILIFIITGARIRSFIIETIKNV